MLLMREYESYVYIVASRSRTLYIGMTNRPQVRIEERKSGTSKASARITAARGSCTSSAALDRRVQFCGRSS